MGQVMTRCPNRDRDVGTGHWMTAPQLQALPSSHAFRCSACGEVHHWVGRDAWVAGWPARVAAVDSGGA
jgi:hypothetical protein